MFITKLYKSLALLIFLGLPLTSYSAPDVQVGFSPEGSARELVLQVINQAHTSIQMIGYSFQATDIAQALVNAHARGVNVRIVIDKKRNRATASKKAMQFIASNGIELRIDGHYHIQHDKTMIVDGKIVETGSFNFAPSAETENSENVVVIRDMPDVTRQFINHWQSRWEQGVAYQGK